MGPAQSQLTPLSFNMSVLLASPESDLFLGAQQLAVLQVIQDPGLYHFAPAVSSGIRLTVL